MARSRSPPTTNHSKAQSHVVAVLAGSLALAAVGMLLVSDAFPRLFASTARRFLAALPLTSIALACVAHQRVRWSEPWQLAKAVVLSAAFLFWARQTNSGPTSPGGDVQRSRDRALRDGCFSDDHRPVEACLSTCANSSAFRESRNVPSPGESIMGELWYRPQVASTRLASFITRSSSWPWPTARPCE